MKKFLITTIVGIATTTAFGAASLRAPQIGGTSTVAAPTATTNTARAGTLRAQTMKTSSVSTPSVTTTQSIAAPVSTETTDARIALLKGIKGFNPGKVKDTTTATNELNSLNDRIEELTAQLDRAEAAQSTILTEANVNDKITASVTEKTYTKTEIDNLLNDIKRKLPTLDGRGNINMTDVNDKLISMPMYYIDSDIIYEPISHSIRYVIPNYYGSEEIANTLATKRCADWYNADTTLWCGAENTYFTSLVGDHDLVFHVHQYSKGVYYHNATHIYFNENNLPILTQQVISYEHTNAQTLRNAVCNGLSTTECWIENFFETGVDYPYHTYGGNRHILLSIPVTPGDPVNSQSEE